MNTPAMWCWSGRWGRGRRDRALSPALSGASWSTATRVLAHEGENAADLARAVGGRPPSTTASAASCEQALAMPVAAAGGGCGEHDRGVPNAEPLSSATRSCGCGSTPRSQRRGWRAATTGATSATTPSPRCGGCAAPAGETPSSRRRPRSSSTWATAALTRRRERSSPASGASTPTPLRRGPDVSRPARRPRRGRAPTVGDTDGARAVARAPWFSVCGGGSVSEALRRCGPGAPLSPRGGAPPVPDDARRA